tara:strand:+ start:451 stop:660 length:210 start_codon:yes stop_codon:yes gene_type:complete
VVAEAEEVILQLVDLVDQLDLVVEEQVVEQVEQFLDQENHQEQQVQLILVVAVVLVLGLLQQVELEVQA